MLRCLLRGLPHFFGRAPKTPLRVLGIVALDGLHVLRRSRPLSPKRIGELAMVLDFLGSANAAWDHKDLSHAEHQATRRRLEMADLGVHISAYLNQLRELESRRPPIGGDHRRFDETRSYREAVARLSISTVTAIALDAERPAEAIRATQCDVDVEALVRILLQCQIIDDVVDYPEDLSASLPSFLTATSSVSQALELTAAASRSYATSRDSASGRALFPLRIALALFSIAAAVVVRAAERRYRHDAHLEEMCRRAGT